MNLSLPLTREGEREKERDFFAVFCLRLILEFVVLSLSLSLSLSPSVSLTYSLDLRENSKNKQNIEGEKSMTGEKMELRSWGAEIGTTEKVFGEIGETLVCYQS